MERQAHPPSARTAAQRKTTLTSVAQLRDALRFGCADEITAIDVSESGPDTLSGDLIVRVLSIQAVAASLQVLDLSFNDLPDAFWTQSEWRKAPRLPVLTTLSLANNRFTEASLGGIEVLLTRCLKLAQLDLSLNSLGYGISSVPAVPDVTALFSALNTHNPRIETLELSCLHISDEQVEVLLATVSLVRSLRRLYLRSNDLTDASAAAVASALSTKRLPVLKVLSLAGNAIGDVGLGALAFVIEESTLETLDLEENQITNAGMETTFHVINGFSRGFALRFLHLRRNRGNSSEQLIDMIQLKLQEKILETHVTISCEVESSDEASRGEVLTLTGKRVNATLQMASVLNDHFASVVLKAIRRCDLRWATLQELDLSGNTIDTAGAWEIGSFLSLFPPQLRLLNLSRNQINDEGVTGLADGLEWNATLAELNLNDNQITDDGAKQLYLKAFTSNLQRKLLLSEGNSLTSECKVMVAAISQAHDLRKRFAKEFAHLEKLDFVGQRLRQYGAAAVAKSLLTTPTAKCTSLDLTNNMLGDEGAVEVAKLLRGYASLTKLDISFNDIGDIGALALADALRDNSTLTSLSLHSSIPGSSISKPRLTDIGLIAIAQALEKHKALTTLDLRDNVMPAALIPALVQMLQRNPRIQKFNGSSAAVFLSRNES